MADLVEGVAVDRPPPTKSMADQIRDMKPGDALAFPGRSLNAVSVAASRLKRANPSLLFTVAQTDEGPTIWRLKHPQGKK